MTAPLTNSPYHIYLTDPEPGGNGSVGLILCDQNGKKSERGIVPDNNPRMVMQVAQGGGYGDFEMPYTPIEISDWSGGRGQKSHETDATRYAHANGVDTSTGIIRLAGLPSSITLPGTANPAGSMLFFWYKGALCLVTQPDDRSGSRLFINGGISRLIESSTTTNANNTQIRVKLNLSGRNLVGARVRLTTKPGVEDDPPYRFITAHTTANADDNTITVSPAWTSTLTTATFIAIDDNTGWMEVTGHSFKDAGNPDNVSSVVVSGEVVYFVRGDDLAPRRGRYTGGSPNQWEWADESDAATAGGRFWQLIRGQDGKLKIWRARTTDSTVWYAEPKAWGTPLTWKQVNCVIGETDSRITGMTAYGQPTIPYIFKEDEVGSIMDDVYSPIPLSEMQSIRTINNGRFSVKNGVYLLFSQRDGIQRYYNQRLDSVGPNLDEGMPENRRGVISGMAAYPGRYFVSIDAGASGYSTVLQETGAGWHPLYEAAQGARIRGLAIQPGEPGEFDRIWVNVGGNLVMLMYSINSKQLAYFRYKSSGEIETSWIRGRFADIPKYWQSIKVFSTQPAGTSIRVWFQTDTLGGWYLADEAVTQSDVQEIELTCLPLYQIRNVTGKRIKFKFVLATTDDTKSPEIERVVINCVTRIPPKRIFYITFLCEDEGYDLLHLPHANEGSDAAMLEAWGDVRQMAYPIVMSTIFKPWPEMRGFIEPPKYRLIEAVDVNGTVKTKWVGSLVFTEA